jgi:hypothetical protein
MLAKIKFYWLWSDSVLQESLSHGRVADELSGPHEPDGLHELITVGTLEQVPSGTRCNKADNVFFFLRGSQNENRYLGMFCLNPLSNFQTVQLRNRSFHYDYVWLDLTRQPDCLLSIVRFTNHFEVCLTLQETPYTLPHHVMPIGKKYPGLLSFFLRHAYLA